MKVEARRHLVRLWFKLVPRARLESRGPSQHLAPRLAVGIVAGLWAVAYGPGTVNALLALAGAWDAPASPLGWSDAASKSARSLAMIGAGLWLVALLARRHGWTKAQLGVPAPDGWRPFRHADTDLAVGSIYLFILLGWAGLQGLLRHVVEGRDHPMPPPSDGGMLVYGVQSLEAGILEELLLVAVLVVALEAARLPTWAIYSIAIVARVSFHLYYATPGTGLLLMLPFAGWAAATIALFRWSRRVIPLIVVHAVWDLAVAASWYAGPQHMRPAITTVFIAVGVALAAAHQIRVKRLKKSLYAELEELLARSRSVADGGWARVDLGRGPSTPELYRGRGGMVLHYPAALLAREPIPARLRRIEHAYAHLRLGHDLTPLSRVRLVSRYSVFLLAGDLLLLGLISVMPDSLVWLQLTLAAGFVLGILAAVIHCGVVGTINRRNRDEADQREIDASNHLVSERVIAKQR